MWEYTGKVKDYFLNPRNVGEIENPDGVGEVGNITCGDALKLTLKIDDNERIVDAKFKTFGCASAIASSSVLTELIKGLTVDEALKITNKEIAEKLGGLPEEKMHCSVMGEEALTLAINNYRGIETEVVEHDDEHEGKIICKCFGVTDIAIKKVVRENSLKTVADVTNYTKAGGACGACHGKIKGIIDEVLGNVLDVQPDGKMLSKKMTNIEKIRLIEEVIKTEIAPYLHHDGGNIELIDIDGNKVYVKLIGTCAVCPSSSRTLKNYVEKVMRERVLPELEVIDVNK